VTWRGAYPRRTNTLIIMRPMLVVKIYRQAWRLANESAAIHAAQPSVKVPVLMWSHTWPAAHAAYRHLSGPTLTAVDGSGSLREALAYLDKVHAITGERYGKVAGPWFDSWEGYLRDRVQHYHAALLAQGQHAAAGIAATLARVQPPPLSTPHLIHNDPNPANFIRSRDGLVGIDWELAAFGDPALDAARAAWEWGFGDHGLGAFAHERGLDASVLRYYQTLHALGRLMSATVSTDHDPCLARRCLNTLALSQWADPTMTWKTDV
jgi:hypothetical protein